MCEFAIRTRWRHARCGQADCLCTAEAGVATSRPMHLLENGAAKRHHTSATQENAMPTRKSTQDASSDAIKLLTTDHKEVKALFKQYDELVENEAGDDEKQALAEEICQMLTVHATVEEELFYPAARDALGEDEDLVDEADIEHASAKELIAQIQGSSPEDAHYDARVKVLGEYIDHHVKEEEGEMFPKLKKAKLDVAALGAEIAIRKEQLMSELSGATSPT
jgi:hemerythrin superfamily protein